MSIEEQLLAALETNRKSIKKTEIDINVMGKKEEKQH